MLRPKNRLLARDLCTPDARSRGPQGSDTAPAAGSFSDSGERAAPGLEVLERGGLLVIRVDLPAMQLEELSISVTDERVTVSDERASDAQGRGTDARTGAVRRVFRRTVRLPEDVVASQVAWTFEAGVLEMMFPFSVEHSGATH